MVDRYQVHMDFEGFRELFIAQQRKYLRKIGILCTVFFVPLSAFAVYMVASEPTLESFGILVMFVLLAILGIADIVRPPAMLATRKPLVYAWFYQHGVAQPDAGPLAQLATDYVVELGAYGFSEQSSTFALNTPWLSLREKPVTDTRGTYFVVDDGKESSALYNMIGVNWALREETVTGVLFIPSSVTAQDPQLVPAIEQRIAAYKQAARGHGLPQGSPEEMKAWIAASGPRQ